MKNEYAERFQVLCKTLARDLIDKGELISAGSKVIGGLKLPEDRVEAVRFAFFAGAEHVFSTLMSVMDSGREPTEADLRRIERVQSELDRWRKTAMASLESAPRGHA